MIFTAHLIGTMIDPLTWIAAAFGVWAWGAKPMGYRVFVALCLYSAGAAMMVFAFSRTENLVTPFIFGLIGTAAWVFIFTGIASLIRGGKPAN